MPSRSDFPTIETPAELAALIRALIHAHGMKSASRVLRLTPIAVGNLAAGGRVSPLTLACAQKWAEQHERDRRG